MRFPHIVSIYNVRENALFEMENNVTILSGVFYDAVKGSNVTKSGLESADAVRLYIPFSVAATDGVTGREKKYLPPNQYKKLEDVSGYWTLETGENCFFLKGEVVDVSAKFKTLNANNTAHRITKIDEKDFGLSSMQHFEVGGA